MAKRNKTEAAGYCGAEGRQARADLRTGYPSQASIDHLSRCPSCRAKIQGAIEKNADDTTYQGDSAAEVIAAQVDRRSYARRY